MFSPKKRTTARKLLAVVDECRNYKILKSAASLCQKTRMRDNNNTRKRRSGKNEDCYYASYRFVF
jgi:hypothetical protein